MNNDSATVNNEGPITTNEEFTQISLRAPTVFRPSSPIDAKTLFHGRIEQVTRIIDTILQPGRHAIIFGERGVGKTSLARVINEFLKDVTSGKPIITPIINCMENDNFSTIWQKIFSGIDIIQQTVPFSFGQTSSPQISNLGQSLSGTNITPEVVERNLRLLSSLGIIVIIIDELDKLKDAPSRSLLTQTIKSISDHSIGATVILVGVSDTVVDLVSDHQSIIRNLSQVKMPRMSKDELREIILKGVGVLGMTIDEDALNKIISLSIGLPHYSHLLGLHAVRSATNRLSKRISLINIEGALEKSIQDTEYSVKDEYEKAIASSRDTIYPEVLLACALAEVNDLGFFTAGSVRTPLSMIKEKEYKIPNFARHLNEFAGQTKGYILQKEGTIRRFQYRFSNPLMQPYIIMDGLKKGKITEEEMNRLSNPNP